MSKLSPLPASAAAVVATAVVTVVAVVVTAVTTAAAATAGMAGGTSKQMGRGRKHDVGGEQNRELIILYIELLNNDEQGLVLGPKTNRLNSFTTMGSGGNEKLPPRSISYSSNSTRNLPSINTTPPTNIITVVFRLPHLWRRFNESPQSNVLAAIQRGWPRALRRGFI
jgi:hypothetical protein